MFLPPRVRSTRPKSRHAQRSVTLNALPLRLLPAKPFSFAATKISIGRRSRCRYDRSRRNHSPFRQRKLESAADLVAATPVPGGPFFTATKIVLHRFPSLGLKSRIDARWHCDDDLQAEPFSFAATEIRIGRGPRCRYGCCRRAILLRGNENQNRTRTSLPLRL